MTESFPLLISFFTCSLFVLGLAIPTIYYGFNDENNDCQKGERAGMILSDWVKITGFNSIAMTVFGYVMIMICFSTRSDIFAMISLGVYSLELLFYIAWWIIGVVIISTTENNSCVYDGTGMAIMAIINLVIGEIIFIYIHIFTSLINN